MKKTCFLSVLPHTVWFSCLRVAAFLCNYFPSQLGLLPGPMCFAEFSILSDTSTSGFSLVSRKWSLRQLFTCCDVCLGLCWKAVGDQNEIHPLRLSSSFKNRHWALCLNTSYYSIQTFRICHDIHNSFTWQEVLCRWLVYSIYWWSQQYTANTFVLLFSSSQHIEGIILVVKMYADIGWTFGKGNVQALFFLPL